ncbi:MAG: hypothetical protein KF833_20710 [Verrucomicrobiae bacterium]|nr:hypothetical protein [Verrucomicrobiae bacterium]
MTTWPIDHVTAFGSIDHLALVLLVLFGRGMDLLSTWVATPCLELEANPIARWLGWRAGMAVNGVVALGVGLLPLAAISIATTSLLVASRNFQSAWLTRVVGELEYRRWIAARYREGRPGVFLICLILHAGLVALVGVGLMAGSQWRLIPFAIGLGVVTYALAIAVFTGLAMRRAGRSDIWPTSIPDRE